MEKELLKLRNVDKAFGDNHVIKDVSLDLEKGKFVTFLGPSGCGKTTLLRLIAGFYNLDNGSMHLKGERIDNISPQKRNTPMVFQEYALFPHMTVQENIAYGLKVQKVNKEEIAKRVKEVINLLNLQGLEERYPNQMSGGQQQRVAIARALINNTELLLLDEPLSNLDAKLRENVRVELRQIQQTLGFTALYVTHDQQEALSMSDTVVVMNKGEIIEKGTPQEIYFNPKTKFVAEFIGTTNFLEGSVVKQDEKYGMNYNNIFIQSDNNEEITKATFSLRPESIILSEKDDKDIPSIKVEVDYSMFLGEKTRYFVKDEQGKDWIIDDFNTGMKILTGDQFLLFPVGSAHYVIEG